MKPASIRGFGTKSVHGANFVSTSPNMPTSKLPLTSRPLDSIPLSSPANLQPSHSFPQVPQLKSFTNADVADRAIDVPDVMPWHNGETAQDYTMHLLALAGSDAFASDSDLAQLTQSDGNKASQKGSRFSKLKPVLLANMFLNAAAKNKVVKAENPKTLAAFNALSAMSEEEKLMYPSWMTEGDIQTRKFLAKKIVNNRNRIRALNIRADEILGTDDIREALAKKYGLNEATYTEVADMISNSRSKVKGVFDDISAIAQEQQAVLQEVQRTLASTSTDLNFEVSNLEDRLDDLQEDSLLQDAERSLGHAKSMRIKLSTSHSRFLDQAVERLTTKMPQVVKIKHMEEDLVLAADSLETMRKTVHEHQANMVKFQREAQEKSEALKLCQKELSEVSKERDRFVKSDKELRSSVESWRDKFYQCDRDLNLEVRRGEEAERQHTAILAITLKNAQKVVEDQIAATARAHEEQVKKLNTLLFQMEQDLLYERRLRDPNAVLANMNAGPAPKTTSIAQQFEDMQSEKNALQAAVDKLIIEVNTGSDERESLNRRIEALMSQLKESVDENKGLATASSAIAKENSAKVLDMQVRIDSLTSLTEDSKAKIELIRLERDDLQKSFLESQQEISRLKSYAEAKPGVAKVAKTLLKKPEKDGSCSVATQTLPSAEATAAAPSVQVVTDVSQQPAAAPVEGDNGGSDALARPMDPVKPVTPVTTLKVVRGTQTDVPYPRVGEDAARFAMSCTRSECVAATKEIYELRTNQLSITAAHSEAQETNSKLTNQLAVRDREQKAAFLKLKKENDMKVAFERESVIKVQTQHEQFRGIVKRKLETVMVEIKKMKRIGDFSNVGEVELHLNDVYIGATENLDSFQAEIDARKEQAEQKSIEASFGASSVSNSDNSQQVVSTDDLKLSAERFFEITQQFISGCSFGINSSSVSLGRVQKKVAIWVEAVRGQKKGFTDSIFQLNLDLEDLKQKLEDSRLVLKSQAVATARAEGESRFWAKKLSAYEDVAAAALEFANSQNGLDFPVQTASKSSAKTSKMGSASKTVLFAKTAGKASNSKSKSESKGTEKSALMNASNSKDADVARNLDSAVVSAEEDLSSCALEDPDESGDFNGEVVQAASKNLALEPNLVDVPDIDHNDRISAIPSESKHFKDSSVVREKRADNGVVIGESNVGSNRSAGVRSAIIPTESEKPRGARRLFDELMLPSISVVYQESSNAPPILDFATQVELNSLRSASKACDTKIRKLEQLLDDKQDQLQHCTILMESSARDHIRARNYATELSLQVHSERSKLQAQREENAELTKKIAFVEEKLKMEGDALAAVRNQELVHAQKLKELTQKMQSHYERCELYVQEERAPFLALFFEFWIRLGLLRKDIHMICSPETSEDCNFRSNCSDLSTYSSRDSADLATSFSEILSRNSLPHLRDQTILMFGHCCSDLAIALHAYKDSHHAMVPALQHVESKPSADAAANCAIQPSLSSSPKILKQEMSLPPIPQIAHKQLVSVFPPKFKPQSAESLAIDDAMQRKADAVVDRLTSKLVSNEMLSGIEANTKLLATWDKFSAAGYFSALKPEKFQSESISSRLPLPPHNPNVFLKANPTSIAKPKPPVLFPIHEGKLY